MPAKTKLSVRQIRDLFSQPQEDMLISAHRGLRWDGVAENSHEAVRAAARAGVLCIEIDIRLTSDGVPVVHHDKGLGRTTNVAEHFGRSDAYNPYTVTGYSPRVHSLPWSEVQRLKLKDEHGRITDQTVLSLDALLTQIKAEHLDLLLFLDVKELAALPPTYNVIKKHTNADAVPALEYSIFKLDSTFYPTPAALEAAPWFAAALASGATPGYIPVFEPESQDTMDVLAAAKSWCSRSYVLGLELTLKGPGAPLQDVVDWGREHNVAMGWFAALGDVHPADGVGMEWDTDGFEFEKYRRDTGPLAYFHEGIGSTLTTYDARLPPGGTPSGKDGRWDLATYSQLGFSWAIADLTNRSADVFAAQSAFGGAVDVKWRDDRVAKTRG